MDTPAKRFELLSTALANLTEYRKNNPTSKEFNNAFIVIAKTTMKNTPKALRDKLIKIGRQDH